MSFIMMYDILGFNAHVFCFYILYRLIHSNKFPPTIIRFLILQLWPQPAWPKYVTLPKISNKGVNHFTTPLSPPVSIANFPSLAPMSPPASISPPKIRHRQPSSLSCTQPRMSRVRVQGDCWWCRRWRSLGLDQRGSRLSQEQFVEHLVGVRAWWRLHCVNEWGEPKKDLKRGSYGRNREKRPDT